MTKTDTAPKKRKEVKLSTVVWVILGMAVTLASNAMALLYLEDHFKGSDGLLMGLLVFVIVAVIYVQCKLIEQFIKK